MEALQHFSLADIEAMEKPFRLNLINSCAGYKPAVLIGTTSSSGQHNLGVFNSVVHIGSSPPMQGFMMRPHTVERHTLENIQETGVYTINHIHESFVEQAHWTSAKFPREVSEFDACGLTAEFAHNFAAPFVGESRLKMGLRLEEIVPIKSHGTYLVIGKIEHLLVAPEAVPHNGRLLLPAVNDVAISGLNKYHKVESLAEFPFARLEQVPNFNASSNNG